MFWFESETKGKKIKMIRHVLLIGLAGGLGTILRYGVQQFAVILFGTSFPWGTFTVNMLGSFLFGLLVPFFTANLVSSEWRVIVLTGFLGGFTTFSSFAYDNVDLLQKSENLSFIGNLTAQNFCGIALVFLGLAVGHKYVS